MTSGLRYDTTRDAILTCATEESSRGEVPRLRKLPVYGRRIAVSVRVDVCEVRGGAAARDVDFLGMGDAQGDEIPGRKCPTFLSTTCAVD